MRSGFKVWAISGDVPQAARASILSDFETSDDFAVLLSTEVGSEGIDLQFCDAVVNYDLPWNPMRVEQRIGRIDRFGQKSNPIDVWSLFVEGTIDTRILQRLYARIRVFEESIGDLDAILGELIDDLQVAAFEDELRPDELNRLLDQKLLAVERNRQMADELESRWHELSAHQNLYRQRVQDIVDSGRVISPGETAGMTGRWLGVHGGDLRPIEDRPGVVEFRVTPSIISALQAEWAGTPLGPQMRTFKERLGSGYAWCTFDASVAQESPGLAFLSHDSAPVRLATDWILRQVAEDPLKRMTTFVASPELQIPEQVGLYVFEVQIDWPTTGTSVDRTERRLLPVVVPESAGVDGDALLGMLSRFEKGGELPADERLGDLGERAQEIANARRDSLRQNAAGGYAARRAQRVGAVCRTIEARLSMKRGLLSGARDERIVRMRQSEIRNLEVQLIAEQDSLKQTPVPVVSHQLVAAAIIEPNVNGSSSSTAGETRKNATPATAPAPDSPLREVEDRGWILRWDSTSGALSDEELHRVEKWAVANRPRELLRGDQTQQEFRDLGVPVQVTWRHSEGGRLTISLGLKGV